MHNRLPNKIPCGILFASPLCCKAVCAIFFRKILANLRHGWEKPSCGYWQYPKSYSFYPKFLVWWSHVTKFAAYKWNKSSRNSTYSLSLYSFPNRNFSSVPAKNIFPHLWLKVENMFSAGWPSFRSKTHKKCKSHYCSIANWDNAG